MNDSSNATQPAAHLPLRGLRVVEMSHMVMGPACGMILADLGAEVIKIEPLSGDRTRQLLGAGAGFFPLFNRNKLSLALDLHHSQGQAVAQRMCSSADVLIENFKPGALARYGLGYESLRQSNERLIYVSHKGFLPGPYQERLALDEVVQMMGGLAYMTGRPGDPLRAGASVNDIMGGMFGAIGVMAALIARGISGKGMEVQSALYENNVFLVGQHMLQHAVLQKPVAPMPARVSPWAIYDVFTVRDDEQIFLAAVSDAQWLAFCDALDWSDLKADPALASNNQRVLARPSLMPRLRERLALFTAADLAHRMERAGLPFAPIRRPEDLLGDEHLLATGGLAPMTLPDGARAGAQVLAPLLPLTLEGQRPGIERSPPRCGEHSVPVLQSFGYSPEEIERLRSQGVVA
jgi:crotonobetainyl-CoA:carnitine CoA-transferase CaiB-like acyl-CoA transferase